MAEKAAVGVGLSVVSKVTEQAASEREIRKSARRFLFSSALDDFFYFPVLMPTIIRVYVIEWTSLRDTALFVFCVIVFLSAFRSSAFIFCFLEA